MNIDSDGASIEDVLSNVLADTGFTFRIKDRTIIIIPSDRTRNQRSVISGRVFSAADGLPVPGVSVYVEGTMSGTFTDADGNEDGNGENEGDEGDEQEPAAELSIEKQWVADLSEEQDGSTRKCFDLATEGKILIILIKQLQAVNGSDGVAARGLVNGRDPYRRYGRDLPDRTFTACQFKRITARHLRMKQFIGIAGGFISGPVFSGPGKRSQINSNAARHLRMKQFIGIAGGFISGPVFSGPEKILPQ